MVKGGDACFETHASKCIAKTVTVERVILAFSHCQPVSDVLF